MRSFRSPHGATGKGVRTAASSYVGDTVHGWRVLERLPSGKYALACAGPGCDAKAIRSGGEVAALVRRELEGRGAGGCRACSRLARVRP